MAKSRFRSNGAHPARHGNSIKQRHGSSRRVNLKRHDYRRNNLVSDININFKNKT